MRKICVGIHVHAEPERLHESLASVSANTPPGYKLILLPDGPDETTKAALRELRVSQSGTEEPRGTAACFNRLAASSDAPVVVLLESGSLVGPRWLEQLLTALDADSHNGLAGPSTNLAWNEQCVYPYSGSTTAEIARTAHDALARFGSQVRALEPLYSLADFCYAVRREVIDALGAAEENYGLGPCWEMDYNIRAARAGWRGVWACAAYVHRAPFTTRRRVEEARRFEASKRRYQDEFCGARLRGEKSDYRPHCRGDACPNFAPLGLIAIRRPQLVTTPNVSPRSSVVQHQAVVQMNQQSEPLVSCIMPTYNRRSFVPQAIRCFLRQDYPNLELLIVDDGTDPVVDCVPESERVRYIRLDRKLPIGAKRNLACAHARGEFIVHWDDDDWYPVWRVGAQVQALLERRADVCGSSQMLFFDAVNDRVFQYRYSTQGAVWVGGTTLAYRKSFWQHHNFPDIQVGEDSRFLWSDPNIGVCDLANPDLCVATIHPGNTSPRETCGAYWQSQPRERIRDLLGDEVNFYRVAVEAPLVSCIMPTYNRRAFVPLALQCFAYQDYPHKELVIVDDGNDAVEDLCQKPNVRYVRLPARTSIGAKRNLACQHAQGEIIAQWDDDDWYAPDRLRYQVAPILAGKADITGLENAFVLDLLSGVFWTTDAQLHQQMFVGNVHGGTLVFRKKLLNEGLRYPEVSLAEDAWLLHYAVRSGKKLVHLSNPGVFIYVRHGHNAWREFAPGRFMNPAGWERIARPAIFSASVLASYQAVTVEKGINKFST